MKRNISSKILKPYNSNVTFYRVWAFAFCNWDLFWEVCFVCFWSGGGPLNEIWASVAQTALPEGNSICSFLLQLQSNWREGEFSPSLPGCLSWDISLALLLVLLVLRPSDVYWITPLTLLVSQLAGSRLWSFSASMISEPIPYNLALPVSFSQYPIDSVSIEKPD